MSGDLKRLKEWAALRTGIWLTSIPSALLIASGAALMADLQTPQTAGLFLLTLWVKVYVRKDG
jgi:hypothetical protein